MGEPDEVSGATARYRRSAMEQRRTVEIGLFGALTSFQIALAAMAVGQAGKSPQSAASLFAGMSSAVLWLAYCVIVIRIEGRNRDDRRIYGLFETDGPVDTRLVQDIARSWAAWPMVPATIIEVALLALLASL